MRWGIITSGALVALLAATAVGEACGRRGRAGGAGGGCTSAGFYGGCSSAGCSSAGFAGCIAGGDQCAAGYSASAWAWRQVGPQLLLEDTATGTLYAQGGDGVFRATQTAGRGGTAGTGNTGGASAAIAADRAKRGSAVFTFDPVSGAARQVGWQLPDGTLRPLNQTAPIEGVAPK